MKNREGKWLKNFIIVMAVLLAATGTLTAVVDPFFHYHAPLSGLYYTLSDQRFQNDGITKHFSYDAVITGTSMTENFKASEFDELFGTQSIKVPYPGATYREISDNLDTALSTHDVKLVLRCLDYTQLVRSADDMRTDMGEYPDYLYDSNPFNDVQYLFNRDAMFEYTIPTLLRFLKGDAGGVTSFDDYGWTGDDAYGREKVLPHLTSYRGMAEQESLTDRERQLVTENITENVLNRRGNAEKADRGGGACRKPDAAGIQHPHLLLQPGGGHSLRPGQLQGRRALLPGDQRKDPADDPRRDRRDHEGERRLLCKSPGDLFHEL